LKLNPDTGNIPQFRTRRDASIAKKIYAAFSNLKDKSDFRSPMSVSRVMHDKDDANVISWDRQHSEDQGYLPVLESKMLDQYNHRYATYDDVTDKDIKKGYPRPLRWEELSDPKIVAVPRKWVPKTDTPIRFGQFCREWMLHVRNITNSIAIRTVICMMTPKYPNNGTAVWIRNDNFGVYDYLYLLGILNSFVLDYLARQKVGGIHLNSYHLYQFPIPEFPSESKHVWHELICRIAFELSYTSWDLIGLARDFDHLDEAGNALSPFRWDEDRRLRLKCEVDAIAAHLYKLDRDDIEWVLEAQYPSESFRVLKDYEIKHFGEYRTKRLVLESYDAVAEASKSAQPYQTVISPPPADPSVAHPPQSNSD
jgi:hypothetical protein